VDRRHDLRTHLWTVIKGGRFLIFNFFTKMQNKGNAVSWPLSLVPKMSEWRRRGVAMNKGRKKGRRESTTATISSTQPGLSASKRIDLGTSSQIHSTAWLDVAVLNFSTHSHCHPNKKRLDTHALALSENHVTSTPPPRVNSFHQDRSSYRAKREKGIIRIRKNRRELFSVQHTYTLFLLHDKKPSLISHTLLLPPSPPSKKKTLILYIVRFADENARCRPPAAGPGRRSSEQRRCYHSPALLCNLQNRKNGVLSLYLRSATP
jgi:hypothetical protein